MSELLCIIQPSIEYTNYTYSLTQSYPIEAFLQANIFGYLNTGKEAEVTYLLRNLTGDMLLQYCLHKTPTAD